MKTTLTRLFVLSLTLAAPVSAESMQPATVKAPPLRNCEYTEPRDLGGWDDVFVCDHRDMIVLRRGKDLFSLSMTDSEDPEKLAGVSVSAEARIVTSVGLGNRLWLFMHARDTAPFAIDAYSKQLSEFDIPGLKIPGESAPGIQSYVIVPHARGAVLMLSGGDDGTWPRDGNRPVYFWMGLTSGKVIRFPIGWDLNYFSGDQEIAVFEKPQEAPFQRRPLQTVDVETGGYVGKIPDRQKGPYVPYDWTDIQSAKPLYVRRAETNDLDHIAGVSVAGHVCPFDLQPNGTHYVSSVKSRDHFAGFSLRAEGESLFPGLLYRMELKQHASPQLTATGVIDFVILDNGNCVYIASAPEAFHCRRRDEVFFRARGDESAWNILDGVQRLPELSAALAGKTYIEDNMQARLIAGFGTPPSLALCLLSHQRMDMRALVQPGDLTVERMTWRRAVILTADGERYNMTELFREENVASPIILHNSGRLIMGNHPSQAADSKQHRSIRLCEIVLRLHEKGEETGRGKARQALPADVGKPHR